MEFYKKKIVFGNLAAKSNSILVNCMYSNNKLVHHLLSLMKQFSISKVVISPGSRHYPIIRSLERDSYFQLYSVVDERSAAFFALGLIQNTGEPVAICCTSGTSSINYGSAVVEAFYQKLPLVVLTADRLPELLNQKEEQMLKQDTVYEGFIRYTGQLKEVSDSFTEWYNNRIINEAFLELSHYGMGPVHLNIPIESHHTDTFECPALPVVRKITRVGADVDDDIWVEYSGKLHNKKVLIVWGQSNPMSDKLRKALDLFTRTYNCVILTDKLSNCHHDRSIENAFSIFYAMSTEERELCAPDIVISLFGNYIFNGEMKRYLKAFTKNIEHWDVGQGVVCDQFKKLTDIFELDEAFFFRKLGQYEKSGDISEYFNLWNGIGSEITHPVVTFGEIYAVGELIRCLPKSVSLFVANSLPIRMIHLFEIDESVKVYCNRGVNGIDGCMSAAVGYASNANDLVFLIIGDLTFFYDMNALWNRHLSKNLRIILLNNEGGGVMHLPLKDELAPELARHVSAGHVTHAKGWVESLGVKYLSASTKEEYEKALPHLIGINSEGPILLEVFSKKEDDVKAYKMYLKALRKPDDLKKRVKRKIRERMTKVFPQFFVD